MDELQLANEIWRDVKGYENRYQVSNLGRVKSLNGREKILKQTLSNGYLVVHLSKNNKKKSARVHRLVAESFIASSAGCNVVDHIDTNTQNNNVSNLRWTTTKGNANNILTRQHKSESKRGKNNPMFGVVQTELLQTLWAMNRKPVKQYTKDGLFVAAFESSAAAQRLTRIRASSIGAVASGKRATAGGFIWKYA